MAVVANSCEKFVLLEKEVMSDYAEGTITIIPKNFPHRTNGDVTRIQKWEYLFIDVDEAVLENIFDRTSYLFEEPENLLKQELREPAVYNSMITAIAEGASRLNEIATRTGMETGPCTKYLKDAGQWWGTDAATRKQVQIDLVGTPVEGTEYIIGSCKFRNERIGVDELELLRNYARAFGKGSKYHFYIFSKGGFTDGLKEFEQKGEVHLLTLEDLYR